MEKEYLAGILKQFQYYKKLGTQTFEQLSDQELFLRMSPDSNDISTIVKHMHGNMMSRFTDFLHTDGEKEWRNREDEFVATFESRDEILMGWNEGWDCVFSAIESVTHIEKIVFIRNQGHTIYEALNRQLAHYAYHVGQIVFIGKCIKDKEWKSLSIPKGKSDAYNQEKFDKPKAKGHYTDEFLDKH